MVMIQAITTSPAIPQRTADARLAAPAPITQPVIVWVVETGIPSQEAANSITDPPAEALKAWCCDSMIGKLIVYGATRERCIMRLKRALEEFVVEGMKTTIPLHQRIVEDPEFRAGNYTIKWLERWLAKKAG